MQLLKLNCELINANVNSDLMAFYRKSVKCRGMKAQKVALIEGVNMLLITMKRNPRMFYLQPRSTDGTLSLRKGIFFVSIQFNKLEWNIWKLIASTFYFEKTVAEIQTKRNSCSNYAQAL